MENEEIGRRGGKRRRDVHDSSEGEKTSMKKSQGRKRRIGSGQKIIWQKKDHEDQKEDGQGEVEEILILDSSEEKNSAIKKEEEGKEDFLSLLGDSGARPSYPGSTISDNIKRLTFHHVLGRGSFGKVRNQNNVDKDIVIDCYKFCS